MKKIEYVLSISEGEYKEEDIIRDFCPSDFFMEDKEGCTMKKDLFKECNQAGHDFEIYSHPTGYYSYDVEMAGHCNKCGFDTHKDVNCAECWNNVKEG